ncbi:patatin-like phospholipase family protein [Siphonobacter curvatus]|uniref:Patatin n=1 Tax=Siphonobacter curvatus TaxID=2094562 RepID=A0A2S7IMK7_9BACT|nr:patatin-like phospholipase family protein [Siphonobacter curvatus]PQA58952.1 patatin [Siphonobacter curvatus]
MKIGIVFSGGAVRGFAHLGILKALQEMGISPDYISGVSAGAIVGAFAASKMEAEAAYDLIERSNYKSYLKLAFSRMGFLKLDRVEDLMQKHLPHTFEELALPLSVNATDLTTGNEVFFNSGPLLKPILASCCLPGIFEPVWINQQQLIDGGVLNQMPYEPLEAHCDILIGCHCNPIGDLESPITSMKAVAMRSLYLAMAKASHFKSKRFDVFIEPPLLQNFNVFDTKKSRDVFRVGYEYTHQMAPELEKLREQLSF